MEDGTLLVERKAVKRLLAKYFEKSPSVVEIFLFGRGNRVM